MKTLATLLLLLICSPATGQAEVAQPNVIIIYADDLGMHDLGCYRDLYDLDEDGIPTPHCDRLAENAFLFTDAHSASAVCTPSRYSLLTGQYAWRTWLKAWVVQEPMPLLIDAKQYTLGQMFQDAGYFTGIVGKWHLGWGSDVGDFQQGVLRPGPLECGFDYALTVPYSHNSSNTMRVFVDGRKILGLPDAVRPGSAPAAVRSLPDTASQLSDYAVAFIEEHQNEPFFLYYPTTNVHFPVTPHPRFHGQSDRGRYGDFCVEFDWAVGEVMAALDRLGLTDNTILIVTSDNGSNEPRSNPYYRGRKCSIYEGGHRIPMLIAWPGHTGTATIDTPLCQTDLLPTLAEHLSIGLPDDAAEDGQSFLPVLQGDATSHSRRPIIHHSVTGRFAIRSGKWKLIPTNDNDATVPWDNMHRASRGQPTRNNDGSFAPLTYGLTHATQLIWDSPGELYDLEADPQEQHNLWEQHPEIVEELLMILMAERTKP